MAAAAFGNDLLGLEQEQMLGRRMAHGRTARERDEARQTLILSNLRLVASVARRYQNDALSYEDLMQEGTIGLINAVDRYDYTLGLASVPMRYGGSNRRFCARSPNGAA